MVPIPPYDVVIAHLEKRQFHDASGMLNIPAKHSAAHYHFRLACIRACNPNFLPTALHIPNDVVGLLSPQHHQHLQLEFGLQIVRHQDIANVVTLNMDSVVYVIALNHYSEVITSHFVAVCVHIYTHNIICAF